MGNDRALIAVLCVMGLAHLIGLDWGLPSQKRAEMVLAGRADANDPALYVKLEENRKQAYQVSIASQALAGFPDPYFPDPRKIVKVEGWTNPFHPFLLYAYSGFLLRTGDGDEQIFLTSLSRMNPRKLDFNPHHYFHAGLYIYSLGGVLLVSKKLGLLNLVPDIKFYYQHPHEMGKLFYAGRLYSVFWGLAGAWLLYGLVLRIFNRNTARWAAFLYLAAPVTYYITHVLKGHALGTALVFALLRGCLNIAETGQLKWYALSSLLGGMIVGTQPHIWFSALAVPWAHIGGKRWARPQSWGRVIFDYRLWLCPVFGILGFIAVSPYIFSAFSEWYHTVTGLSAVATRMSFNPWQWMKAWFLGLGSGLNLAAFALASFGFFSTLAAWPRLDMGKRFLAGFTAGYFMLFALYMGHVVEGFSSFGRHAMPLIGLFCVYGAWTLDSLFSAPKPWQRALAAAAGLYIAAVAGWHTHNYWSDARNASYYEAGRWISQNIPKRSSVGMSHLPHTDLCPPFDFANYALWTNAFNNNINPETDEMPDYFLLVRNPNFEPLPVRWTEPFKRFQEFYEPARLFGPKPRFWDFTDHFSGANYPVWIYKRKT